MNKDHVGWKLSRTCIQDTLYGKRIGMLHCGSSEMAAKIYRAMYPLTISNLRGTQLAPHVETKMIAGRYGMLAKAGEFEGEPCSVCDASIDPAVYVRRADNPFVNVIVDNDYYVCEKCLLTLLDDLKAGCLDMNVVYTDEDNGVIWMAGPESGAKGFMVADYYRFTEGDAEERRQFLYALLYAHQPGMMRLERNYPWFGVA